MRKQKLAFIIATWFGTGCIPPIILPTMGGTYGSIAAMPLCLAVVWLGIHVNIFLFWAIVAIVFDFGLVTVPIAEHQLGPRQDRKEIRERDQNQIVVDEVLGMLVTFIPLVYISFKSYFWTFLVGLVLFRFFDVVKPWPVRKLDRMKSSFGVMMDDVMAGVYAAICLGFAIWFLKL